MARSKISECCWARKSPRPPLPRSWTSPALPSTTSSRPERSSQAEHKARPALCCISTVIWSLPLCAAAGQEPDTGAGLNSAAPHGYSGIQKQPRRLSVHDEFRDLDHATIFATCCSSRVSCLFRACRGELFAAGAGPRPPPSHPGEPRATICALLLAQDPQYQTAVARA